MNKTRGVNHSVKVNYGTQVLNLLTGAQHYPSVPRKLEDEDYRCENAAYKQDQLLPLSRLPRPVTSMYTNADVSSYYNKPLSGSDIERSRVAHNIKGNLRDLVSSVTVNVAPTQTVYDVERTNPMLLKLKEKAVLNNTAPKHITVSYVDKNLAARKPPARIVRKVPAHSTQYTKGTTVHNTSHVTYTLDKKLSAPAGAHKEVTLYEIRDPNIELLTKLKTGDIDAGKTQQVYDTIEQMRAMAAMELQHKLVPDPRAQSMNKLTAGVYTDSDHARQPDTARLDKKVEGETNVNNMYPSGYVMDDQVMRDNVLDLALRRKNAYCQEINPAMYSSHRNQFERHLNIQGINDIPYNKGAPFIFVPVRPGG